MTPQSISTFCQCPNTWLIKKSHTDIINETSLVYYQLGLVTIKFFLIVNFLKFND